MYAAAHRDMPSLSRHTGVAAALGSSSSQSWWERDCPSNMKEANGVQELIDALADAGDRLVIVVRFGTCLLHLQQRSAFPSVPPLGLIC